MSIQNNKNKKENNKTMKKKILVSFAFLIVLFYVSLSFVSAENTNAVSYCCEKTVDGAFCQNGPLDLCDVSVKNTATGEKYLATPTSCESTSYCKTGTCYDSDEGLCMEKVPEEVCRQANGLWSEKPVEEVPQCSLGCCVLGTEAAYVTLARCNKLAGNFGLEPDFRRDVQDELSCVSLATSQEQGACVFESDFVNTCKFTTRQECNSLDKSGLTNTTSVKFYKDYLCTAEELNTNCAKSTSTICDSGKVYFTDTCRNKANIYDASKANNVPYWTKIVTPEKSCDSNSKNCGNCDYLEKGTTCSQASVGDSPTYGDYVCKDINCYNTENGKDYKNGESWCSYDTKNDPNTDSVGSRNFRHTCFMGEEIIEPCADFRNEVCVENSIGEKEDFSQAGCAPNKWQDCVLYGSSVNNPSGDKESCLDSSRDCMWIPFDLSKKGFDIAKGYEKLLDVKELENSLLNIKTQDNSVGVCVPKIAPGLQFWDSSSQQQCSIASNTCVVKYEKGLLGGKKCVENCFCDPDTPEGKQTAVLMATYCSSLGDCGPGPNYIGTFVNKGYEITIKNGKEKADTSTTQAATPSSTPHFGGQPKGQVTFPSSQDSNSQTNTQNTQPSSPTGNVIQGLLINTYNKVTGNE